MANPISTFWKSSNGIHIRWMLKNGQAVYLRDWWDSIKNENYLLDKPSPWITFNSRRFLTSKMRPNMKIFEWGSGGSTLFWLQHNAQVVSVEHDAAWSEILAGRLSKLAAADIDYRLVPAEKLASPITPFDVADPRLYLSGDDRFTEHQFVKYATQIDEFPDQHFDIILVDGRARPACIVHAINKVKVGGWLVIDNANIDYYFTNTRHLLSNYEKFTFYGAGPLYPALWQTDIYLRKS